MRIPGMAFVAAVIFLFLPSEARAVDRYAAVGGTGDPALCSESDPCDLVDALSESHTNSGDRVHAGPGTHEIPPLTLLPSGVSLLGQGVEETRIELVASPSQAVAGLVLSFSTALEDLTIDTTVTGRRANRAIQTAYSPTIRRVVAVGIDRGCAFIASSTAFITDSVCRATGESGAGLSVGGNENATVEVRNVTAIGARSGLLAIQNKDEPARSSVIIGVNVIAVGGMHDLRAEFGPNAHADSGAVFVLSHSNYSSMLLPGEFGGLPAATATEPTMDGNQIAEPVFVDAEAGDYRQAKTSPTIDAGNSAATGLGPTDLFRSSRIFGPAVDIGAHEASPADDDDDGDPGTPGGGDDGTGQPSTPTGPGGAGQPDGGDTGQPGGGPSSQAPRCAGKPATIVGTSRGETLVGTPGDDVIVALGGNDRIRSGGGNDIICAGPGNDKIWGGAGNDRILGQGGNDVIHGQAGNDVLMGGAGRDSLFGGGGNDRLSGQAGPADRLFGGPGRDALNGGAGPRDLCDGGPGKNRLAGKHPAGCEAIRL